jgi:translation elongation factor EF-Tu-like GTPase
MASENSIGTFSIEDSFVITGRGLVLAGQLVAGQVATGNYLIFEHNIYWKITAVNFINKHNRTESFGLLMEAPTASQQEFIHKGIVGIAVPIVSRVQSC